MAVTTTISITHDGESVQTVKDLIRRPSKNSAEECQRLTLFFQQAASRARRCSFDVQVNGGDAVAGSGTLTVATGVATDTATVAATTFTCVDHRETTNVTFGPDIAGSLNSTFFKFEDQSGASKYYVWFNINSAGVDPAPAGRTGIEVDGATAATAATLATATVTACGLAGLSGVSVVAGASGHIIIRDIVAGVGTAVADGTAATGFTFTRTITGSAVTSSQYNVGLTDTATATNLKAAINASAALIPYVSALSALGVVTVTATQTGIMGNAIALSATGGVSASGTTLASGAAATANTYHCGL